MRLAASIFCLVACGVSFALVTAVLRPLLGGGDEPDSRREIKFREFAERKDEFDTLFIGSSRTFRGFDPGYFDRLMAEAGTPTRTFNFGIPGARVMEVDRLLERIVALKPANLRRVFLDPERFQILILDENALSRSVIDWHDLDRTRVICSYVLVGEDELARGWRRIQPHVIAAAYNFVGVGRGLAITDSLLGVTPDADYVLDTLGPMNDGFPGRDGTGPRHRRFLRFIEDYHELLRDYRELEIDPGPPAPQALQALDVLVRRVESLGARPIFFTQPGLYYQDDLVNASEAGLVDTLLRYDHPDVVPELYVPEARFDANHLNNRGAALITELLARDLAALIADRESGQ